MTLEEKCSLLSGRDFWTTMPLPRVGVPSILMTDGPHGLRRLPDGKGRLENTEGNESAPSTCFPAAVTLGCTWDPALARRMGEAIAAEALEAGISIILGPGVNIKRSPLCGRNFEYYSEDPLLTAALAGAFVDGAQGLGVGTSLKHFAANNSESWRMTSDSAVDERALREIYLRAFEDVVKRGKPYTVMCAYNKIDGVYCSENERLLTNILRGEWGYDGVVISDWGAVNDRVAGLKAGLDLEMPGGGRENDEAVAAAVRTGTLPEEIVDRSVDRLIDLALRCDSQKRTYLYDRNAHRALAREIACAGAVLLKNEKSALPLSKNEKVALIGRFGREPRYQGAGSSYINPSTLVSPLDAFRERKAKYLYTPGYGTVNRTSDAALLERAVAAAKRADKVVLLLGLPALWEGEGFDRTHMRLPSNQLKLANTIINIGKPVVVVLYSGSPVELPFVDRVQAVLHMHLPGQEGGAALYDLLYGLVNPSGKLAESYPVRYSDVPCASYFPGNADRCEYRESIYVGYRYYDSTSVPVAYPFGHGLSYTRFAYSDLRIEDRRVSFTLRNTGERQGCEITQLYVKNPLNGKVFRPAHELRAFKKTALAPGEAARVDFYLDDDAFSCYNILLRRWIVENGEYGIEVGSSSRDIKLTGQITISDMPELEIPHDRDTLNCYFRPTVPFQAANEQFSTLFNKKRIKKDRKKLPLTLNSPLSDYRLKIYGKKLYRLARFALSVPYKRATRLGGERGERLMVKSHFLLKMLQNQTIRGIALSSSGLLPPSRAEGIVDIANGRVLRGLKTLMTKRAKKK